MTAPDPIRARLDEWQAYHDACMSTRKMTTDLLAAVRAVAEIVPHMRSTDRPLEVQLIGDDLHHALAAAMTTRDGEETDRG